MDYWGVWKWNSDLPQSLLCSHTMNIFHSSTLLGSSSTSILICDQNCFCSCGLVKIMQNKTIKTCPGAQTLYDIAQLHTFCSVAALASEDNERLGIQLTTLAADPNTAHVCSESRKMQVDTHNIQKNLDIVAQCVQQSKINQNHL